MYLSISKPWPEKQKDKHACFYASLAVDDYSFIVNYLRLSIWLFEELRKLTASLRQVMEYLMYFIYI